jgi:glycosyltransferase involved in cell wall biosynthesis
MLISLIHPSRGRAKKSHANTIEWIRKAGCDVECIVSIDSDDPTWNEYVKTYYPYTVIINQNKSVVDATNVAAKRANGDILVYLSDDFKCPDNWGIKITSEFVGVKKPKLIKVDDCLQPFRVAVLTIPIMNRELYERLGYFWHPSYKSMFVDEDLYWTAKKLGALAMAPHLKFPHEHVSIGKAENDDTYIRSAKNWDTGKHVFANRKAMNFPL